MRERELYNLYSCIVEFVKHFDKWEAEWNLKPNQLQFAGCTL